MTISGREYLIARQKKIERRKKMLTIVSIVSFSCSGGFAVVSSLKQAAIQNTKPVTVSAESEFQQQVRGFELVLQREPENQVALEGLAMARIHMKDAKGAISPLEKLVKQHPERQDYKVVLEQVRKEAAKGDR